MADPKLYQFDLPNSGRPDMFPLNEQWYPGVQAHWSQSTSNRSVDVIRGIKAIVIHATAGSSSSGAMSVMKNHRASWHWLVPDEDEAQHGEFVWACAPEKRAAWHVRGSQHHPDVNGNAKSVNQWSLGVEIVNAQGSDKFSNWQVEATAEIVRYAWAKYPNLRHIVSHAKLDPSRRSDPGDHFPWNKFESLVRSGTRIHVPPALVAAATPMSKLSAAKATGCCM